ncbi:sodium/hydrogen exchanger 3-like isoform X2 [Neolamprologus brichardi]|uniref:sodium/hydrogen exchanger 3-like isoform X2 n=1 Tax=Neolamprologus brichardi TaxID=32507 RepID=UPI001643BA01|nr:sodium/hydrogen exchanger 3-like isoform X2 [Neolamprologus brichardi]
MATLWRFTLFLCMLLMACGGLSLASKEAKTRSSQTETGTHNTTEEGGHGAGPITTLPIVTWKWDHISVQYLVALWVLVCWLCKLLIEANHNVTNYIPESALLICSGFILGGMIWGADKVQTFSLNPTVFFYFLLPQIILDSGYHMPNKLFFTNLGAILIHAVIGTCWNAASLGLSLWGCHMGGAMGDLDIGLLQYLLFGSLMAAVDPVAVLAVFDQVHVNEVLFIIVFGESLLNDGVTVVLFNVFDAFVSLGGGRINAAEIIKGIVSFFVVAFGGSLVGIAFGILISLLTRCTKNIQIIEPGFIFVMGYLSYLTAEMLSLSAILSTTFCGVLCQKYVRANMDESSVQTVKYAMKVFANGSETIIFVFLGISAIDKVIWVWNTGFILLTVFFVFVYRFIGVFFLQWILNRYRLVPVELMDMVIMSYGGLRGAVAYGLAVLLDEKKIKEKNLMICTTLIVVYFTVILQGITMKPLVMWLKVKRAAVAEVSLLEKITNKMFNHTLVAIEDISGQIGDNYFRSKWRHFEEKWMTPFLMKPSARKKQDDVFDVFHQLNLKDAMEYVTEGERRGSLEFVRNDSAILDFKKKLESEYTEAMPDIPPYMIHDDGAMFTMGDHIPSVSLEMHEQTMKAMREPEAVDVHHLLDQHLYKSRKQYRHGFSRSDFKINRDEKEVQEIFQRTMRNRLESFKSAKMGVSPPKTLVKYSKKEQQEKIPNGKSVSKTKLCHSGDEDFEFSEGDSASGYDSSYPSFSMRATYRPGGGIENPAFMPDLYPTDLLQEIPPWLAEGEPDSSMVAPSLRAQANLPNSPMEMHRLGLLPASTRSTDTKQMNNDQLPPPPTPPPPPPPSGHM